jgi:hypothetical protein
MVEGFSPLCLGGAEAERDELDAVRHDQPIIGLASEHASLILLNLRRDTPERSEQNGDVIQNARQRVATRER